MPEEQSAGSGPHLAAALLCEKVLQEKDSVMSFIRIVDRFPVPEPEPGKPPSPVQATLVVVFKAGDTSGKHYIKIRPQKPSGGLLFDQEFPVLFEGQDRGVAIVAPMTLVLDEEGLYWFDVTFEEKLVTRIPLRVLYQRVGQSSPGK